MIEAYPNVPKRQWEILANGLVAPHTGATAETALATVVVPANAMGPSGLLRITTMWSNNNNGNNKTGRVRLGGSSATTGTIYQETTQTTQVFFMDNPRIILNLNNAASQKGRGTTTTGAGGSGNAVVTSSIDTTAAFNLMFTGQLANSADNIELAAYLVELLYGP